MMRLRKAMSTAGHGSGRGTGGDTGAGDGGTIDSGGSRMDQGGKSPATGPSGNGSGSEY